MEERFSRNEYGIARPYTRHRPDCRYKDEADYNKCSCPKWVYARTHNRSKVIRQALGTPSWADALKRTETILAGFNPEVAAARAAIEEKNKKRRTVQQVCDLWIDRTKREFSQSLVEQYQSLTRHLVRWADAHGIQFLDEITTEMLDRWYSSAEWTSYAATTRAQRWGVLRSIFNFWVEKKLLIEDPIKSIKAIKAPVGHVQGPYTDEQVTAIFAAIGKAVPKNLAPDARPLWEKRVRTFLNLLLHTGSDLGDAILYEQDRITEGGKVNGKTVYVYRYERNKTGIPAIIPLIPTWLVEDLRSVPPMRKSHPELPFRSKPENDLRWEVRAWLGRIQRILAEAGVEYIVPKKTKGGKTIKKAANAKQLRHTFAVRMLKQGQRTEDVAKMLGHIGDEMIRKHYAPWVKDLDEAYIQRVATVSQQA
jgi:site-specific recombinase XerD